MYILVSFLVFFDLSDALNFAYWPHFECLVSKWSFLHLFTVYCIFTGASGLANLKELQMSCNKVTDAGVGYLEGTYFV